MSGVPVELRGVRKSFGGLVAVDDVNITLEPGRVTALIGPNGAGKTTLLDIATGEMQADGGDVRFGDRVVTRRSVTERAALPLSRVFQGTRLFGELTARQHFQLVLRRGGTSVDEAMSLLDEITGGLQPAVDQLPCSEAPYEVQKLLPFVLAVARRPSVLLLDEPTVGLPPQRAGAVTDLARKLSREGCTVVLVEHNLDVVRAAADHVVFMANGAVLLEGDYEEVVARDDLRSIYFGV